VNSLALRGFLVEGKPDAVAKSFKEGVRVYPLAQAKNPRRWRSSTSRRNRRARSMRTTPRSTRRSRMWPRGSPVDCWRVTSNRGGPMNRVGQRRPCRGPIRETRWNRALWSPKRMIWIPVEKSKPRCTD